MIIILIDLFIPIFIFHKLKLYQLYFYLYLLNLNFPLQFYHMILITIGIYFSKIQLEFKKHRFYFIYL